MGSIGQNSTFENMVMLQIKLNGITKYSNMVAIISPADPPPDLRVKRQNSTFSEHDHVQNQINGITRYSNMVANILPADHQIPT